MRRNAMLSAFTLMEVLTVISILSIIALWASRLDFNRLSQTQKIQIELGKIISTFEEVRNNSLIGRWVGSQLITPSQWQITIENTNSSGSITAEYLSGTSLEPYTSWESPFPFSISDMKCSNLDTSSQVFTSSGVLVFEWWNISLEWCSSIDKAKILEFTYWVGSNTKRLYINTLSWIVQQQ